MTHDPNKIKVIFSRFKDLTTIGFANVISSAISGIFWFYLASLLGTEHYGEVSYFIAIAGIVSVVSFLGSGTTLVIYTAKGEKILSTIFSVTVITSIISSIVLFFVFNNIGVSLYIIGYVIFGLATAELIGKKLYKDYSKYIITQKILFVAFTLFFYYIMGPQGVILGYALSFFPYFLRIYKGFRESKPNISIIKPRIGFMINSYVLDLSRTFSGQTDKLIIGPMFGFAILGNYQLGIQFLSLLSLLPSIVYQYILPHDASGNPNKKLKRATILVSVVLAILGITLSPIVLPILFPKFTHAIQVIQIISLATIPNSINLMYISKFLGKEKSRIILIGSGIYLLIQILSILVLGKLFGVNGVAIALVLAATAESIFLITTNRLLQKDLASFEENQSDNDNILKSQSVKSIIDNKRSIIKNPVFSLIIIGSIAIFLRLYYLPHDIPITFDGLKYFWYSNDLALGHVLTRYEVPNNGWPIFLSVFFSIFHFNNFMDYMMLQRLVSVSISVLTIIPVYFLCNRFFNKFYSILGAAIFVFEPHIIQNSLLGITDPLYILLLTVSLVFFTSSNKKIMYASFSIVAFASIVRVEGLFMFIALSILFFVRDTKERKTIMRYGLALCIFILSLYPMIIFRIESVGNDNLTTRMLTTGNVVVNENLNGHSAVYTHLIPSIEAFVRFFGLSLIPIFMFFIPLGIYFLFRIKNKNNTLVIVSIILLLLSSFAAFYSGARDTRYFYPLFPLFSILSIMTVKTMIDKIKIKRQEIILILLISLILLLSLTFLHFKNMDIKHEKEALSISYYVANITSGINPYQPESQYLPITEMAKHKFPLLSTDITLPQNLTQEEIIIHGWLGPKIISTDGFNSLDEYIKSGKNNGLTHLVVDEPNNSPYRSSFLNDVYYYDEKYPYLTKVFDSYDYGYNYHLKIYKINYEKFESVVINK